VSGSALSGPAPSTGRLLVFGASGHIGGPLARRVRETSPRTALRLATSSAQKQEVLQRDFPGADVVVADYLDGASLATALEGVEGVFIVTPDFFDEERGMGNLVDAVQRAGTVQRAVRIVGVPPNISFETDGDDSSPAMGHVRAVQLLRRGGVPLTVLSCAGYLMDDLAIHFGDPLRQKRTLVVPYERRMCFTDPADLGEMAAHLLLRPDDLHLDQTYFVNSGEEPMTFRRVAELLAEVLGVAIAYDPSPEGFVRELGPLLTRITGDEQAAQRLLGDFRAEQEHESSVAASPVGGLLLGRRPTTLRQWIEAHRDALAPA
jgi:uncharacterized protein YbjT (DUF2867 family)